MTGSKSNIAAELEKAEREIVQMRREVLRWKMLARQHEARIREIESSASWRWSAVFRALPSVTRRWKALFLLAVIACVTLPFWPLILVLMIFASGRAMLWSILWKIRPVHDLLSYVKQRVHSVGQKSRGNASAVAPLVFRRPVGAAPSQVNNDALELRWQLMQQLCPQQRVVLERFKLSRNELVTDSELPELRSLNRNESSILRTIVGQYQLAKSIHGETR